LKYILLSFENLVVVAVLLPVRKKLLKGPPPQGAGLFSKKKSHLLLELVGEEEGGVVIGLNEVDGHGLDGVDIVDRLGPILSNFFSRNLRIFVIN
jgi:hypothetical protein